MSSIKTGRSGKKRHSKPKRKKLVEKLWKSIRDYILLRDNNQCQWCDATVRGSNAHVSHVIPRSHGNTLKYDELNLKLLCYHCHMNVWHKSPLESYKWFKGKFPERYEYLMKKKEDICKLRDEDLMELTEMYKVKYENLKGLDI